MFSKPTHQIVCYSSKMHWILSTIIAMLLSQLIWKRKEGRVKQSVSIQAKRINIVIKNKNHQQGFSNIQKIEESARQQPPVQNEDDTEQLTKINNDMRILRLLRHQRSANKVEDDESEGSCNNSDNGHNEFKLPRYKDFVKSEIDSSDKDDEW